MFPIFIFHIDFSSFLCYVYLMSITQTVKVPKNRRLVINVPSEIPTGSVTLTFTPKATEQEPPKLPVFGCAKGQFWMAEDFDAPLEDFKDYM
jgi:hypothetical protein